ncbi:MAG: ATP-binding protein [Chlorobium sp.]
MKNKAEYERYFGKAILESIPGFFSISDADGRMVCWNDTFRDKIIGKPESKMPQTDVTEIFHPDDKVFAVASMRSVLELGLEKTIEVRVFLHDGPKYQWWMITARRVSVHGTRFLFAVGIDITERKRFDVITAFRTSLLKMAEYHSIEELLQVALDEAELQTESCIGFCHFFADDHSKRSIRVLSTRMQSKKDQSDELVSEFLFNDPVVCAGVVREGSTRSYSEQAAFASLATADPQRTHVIPFMQGAAVAGIFCVAAKPYDYDEEDTMIVAAISHIAGDIVARKFAEHSERQLQEELLTAQKMQLVGQLAGGISHDFYNMLRVIVGNVEMAMKRTAADDVLLNNLQAILEAARCSAGVTTQLLAFSRNQTIMPVVLELNLIIERMLAFLRRLIGKNISLVWIPESYSTAVKIDPSQIELILGNTCLNSRDAITDSGRITIETSRTHIDQAECHAGHPCKEPGDYITLTVSDNGCGIDKKHFPHIFEPFFTTKPVGKNSGLGLSSIYGIVQQNLAFVECQSEKGKGTTFKFWLPRHYGYAEPEVFEAEESIHSKNQSTKTILFVVDAPDILNICKLILENHGYEVLSAATHGDAITIARNHHGNIHLLLTDVVLPDRSGCDLSEKLVTTRPNLKTLFMSGYTTDPLPRTQERDASVGFLRKPFSSHTLLGAVQKIISHAL